MHLFALVGACAGYSIWLHSSFGGRSHIGRMLEIGEELVDRGHRVSYVALSDNLAFAQGTRVATRDLGGGGLYRRLREMAQAGLAQDRRAIQHAFHRVHQAVLHACYRAEHPRLAEALRSPPDLLVCDGLAYACQDLAREGGIPLVISTQAYLPQQLGAIARKHAIRDYGLLVSTSFLGLEPATPAPPTLRFLGPLPMATPALDDDSLRFLTAHRRVAYVGFGSLLVLTKQEIVRILDALQAAVEADLLDGVVWGAAATALADFPPTLAVNATAVPLARLGHFRILAWANQHAVLAHPSTKLIITHAGLESVMEAIATGTPALAMPFVFDQPRNAQRIAALGIGQVVPITADSATLLHAIRAILGAEHRLAHLQAIVDPNARQSAANLLLGYAATAIACRKTSPFDPRALHPPCELAHLVPLEPSHLPAYVGVLSALLLTLLLARLAKVLLPEEKGIKLD